MAAWGGPWPPASLSCSFPSLPPVWLAVQPPPSSPHLSNHRAPHLLLVNSGKKRGKKKGKTEKCGVAARLGASLSDGPGLAGRPRAGCSGREQELGPRSPGARAGRPWERRPERRAQRGEEAGRTVKGAWAWRAQQAITHRPVQLSPFIDVKSEAQSGKVTCPQ